MSRIVPLLKYDDAPKAIDWLCRMFGFLVRMRVPGSDGSVAHAQLERGGALLFLSSTRPDENGLTSPRRLTGMAHVIYVVEPQVEALFAKLRANGTELLGPIEHDEHGIRRFQVKDLEGHVWSFSDYDPLA